MWPVLADSGRRSCCCGGASGGPYRPPTDRHASGASGSARVAVAIDQGVEHRVELIACHGDDRPPHRPRRSNVGDAAGACTPATNGAHDPRGQVPARVLRIHPSRATPKRTVVRSIEREGHVRHGFSALDAGNLLVSRVCAKCGEENLENFGACWKCQAGRPTHASNQRLGGGGGGV
jgi:hypothetical protein